MLDIFQLSQCMEFSKTIFNISEGVHRMYMMSWKRCAHTFLVLIMLHTKETKMHIYTASKHLLLQDRGSESE